MTRGVGLVVSVDLWDTLVTMSDREAAEAWRVREFHAALHAFEYRLLVDQVRSAVTTVRVETRRRQRTAGDQIPARDQVAMMLARMGIDDDALVDVLLVPHAHAALRALPEAMPDARVALQRIKASGARLVLASNTLATPAHVTRAILDGTGLAPMFDDMVFSDEIGAAKPRREFFHALADRAGSSMSQTIHVGDDWQVDVVGALHAGCRAVWFNPAGDLPRPDVPCVERLAELPARLADFAAIHR